PSRRRGGASIARGGAQRNPGHGARLSTSPNGTTHSGTPLGPIVLFRSGFPGVVLCSAPGAIDSAPLRGEGSTGRPVRRHLGRRRRREGRGREGVKIPAFKILLNPSTCRWDFVSLTVCHFPSPGAGGSHSSAEVAMPARHFALLAFLALTPAARS